MRLDLYLINTGQVKSRTYAAELVKSGLVCVNGNLCTKPSYEINENDEIIIEEHEDYASAGAKKLQKAIVNFKLDLTDLTAVDIGASNGGFTDVLLRNRVKKVYAVDVAPCALPKNLLDSGKVIVRDNLNARNLTVFDIGEQVDLATADVSFISLKLILPAIYNILKKGGICIALVKPQFELNKNALTKKGMVKTEKLRESALSSVIDFAKKIGYIFHGFTSAPEVIGKNIEYLIFLEK